MLDDLSTWYMCTCDKIDNQIAPTCGHLRFLIWSFQVCPQGGSIVLILSRFDLLLWGHVCVCEGVDTCVCVRVWTRVCVCEGVDTCVCVCGCGHVCVCVCGCGHVCVCVCGCGHVCVWVWTSRAMWLSWISIGHVCAKVWVWTNPCVCALWTRPVCGCGHVCVWTPGHVCHPTTRTRCCV